MTIDELSIIHAFQEIIIGQVLLWLWCIFIPAINKQKALLIVLPNNCIVMVNQTMDIYF